MFTSPYGTKTWFMNLKTILCFLFLISLYACDPSVGSKPQMREAWVPVYSTDPGTLKIISSGPSRPTIEAGKIYTVGNLIYQVEVDSGIHVINYSNPSSPQKLGFIQSFLCKEVTVKNGLIYTNNGSDLVVIEATSISGVREVARTPNVFPDLALQYPPKPDPLREIWFECPDPGKGVVVKWEKKTIDHAKCRR